MYYYSLHLNAGSFLEVFNMNILLSLAEEGVDLLQDALDIWNEYYTKIITVLTTSPESLYSSVWNAMKTVNNYLSAIGVALVVIFFYIGLTKNVIRLEELKRPANFFGLFIRLVLAQAFVANSSQLLLKIMEIIQGCIVGISNLFGGFGSGGRVTTVPNEIVTLAREADWISGLGIWVLALIGAVLIWAVSLIMLLLVYMRFFRIYIYTAIAPLPLATLAGENTSRTARSFLMTYIGACLQGVIIAIAFIIFIKVANTGFSVDSSKGVASIIFSYIGTIFMQLLLLVITVRSSEKTVRDIIGG